MNPHFEIELLPEAVRFLEHLDNKAREKIYYNLRKSQFINDQELLKKLNDNIWEFRTLWGSNAYRLFAFWDQTETGGKLIIATHGILKKTQKTPTKEIRRAETIRHNYLEAKYR